jgi:hypothetical protein
MVPWLVDIVGRKATTIDPDGAGGSHENEPRVTDDVIVTNLSDSPWPGPTPGAKTGPSSARRSPFRLARLLLGQVDMQNNRHLSAMAWANCIGFALTLGACSSDPNDPIDDDAGRPGLEIGSEATSARPELGVPSSLPPDSACLGSTLSEEEARSLCQWGTSLLGPAGTVFKASCLDIYVDAGAPPPDPSLSMVDMVVLPEATCIADLRSDSSSPCVYTVGQFKYGVAQFQKGACGAGAGLGLVGYLKDYR